MIVEEIDGLDSERSIYCYIYEFFHLILKTGSDGSKFINMVVRDFGLIRLMCGSHFALSSV